jgi:hypothetical protein
MMREIILAIALILGYLLFTAKSCEPETLPDQDLSSEYQHNLQIQEAQTAFTAEYITADRLWVFEECARLKLNNLVDYLNLYAGKEIDTLFRQQALAAIGRLFRTNEDLNHFFRSFTREFNGDISSCTGFSGYRERTGFESLQFSISNVRVVKPLQPDRNGAYSGEIECALRISGIHTADTVLISDRDTRMKIIAARTSKPFGDDHTLLVWQVFLASAE